MHEVTDKSGKHVVQRKSPGAQEGAFPKSFKYLCEAMEQADKIRDYLPIHMILGSGEGILYVPSLWYSSYFLGKIHRPECVREGLIDVKKGRCYESLSYIPNLGHMVSFEGVTVKSCSSLIILQIMQIDPDAVVRSVSGIIERFADAFTPTTVFARL